MASLRHDHTGINDGDVMGGVPSLTKHYERPTKSSSHWFQEEGLQVSESILNYLLESTLWPI